jgi:cysteine-rich repeat protein
VWGDGIKVTGEEWDDGNATPGDGWDGGWNVETGWIWDGGTIVIADTWSEICGDGIRFNSLSTYCDDGNNADGDGWSMECSIEPGYECNGGSSTTPDSWIVICGDGILTTPTESWDDGNTVSNDGWSNLWQLEPNFDWTSNVLNNPATTWVETCGDGVKLYSSGWDDGNLVDGDGWSSSCSVEPGYQWSGGSPTSPDTCLMVWGDGISATFDPTEWDDGNAISGDGCSSSWKTEPGYQCITSTLTTPSVWGEIWGDGKRLTAIGWDDGNNVSGDGCSSTWVVEAGYTWSGGSATKKDTWKETWGDGKKYGGNEWDDGNLIDGDGWSKDWEIEHWKACSGGSSTTADTCFDKVISASIGELINNKQVSITFSEPMLLTSFGFSDLSVGINSAFIVDFSWSASYSTSTTLDVNLSINSALQGGEELTIKLINSKKFRSPTGGCVKPSTFKKSLESSLSSTAASAKAASGFSMYLIMGGMMVMFSLLIFCGTSLEMIWSLINTLQLISFLPIMISYYPEHVKVMFEILEFSNMEISFFSDFFKSIIKIDSLDIPSYNDQFLENGIESPLFLDNWASLLFSLIFSASTLLLLVSMYLLLRWEKLKLKLSSIISSYFFNNFLRFFTEGYLEMFFGALLNVMAFPYQSIPELISLVLSFIGLVMWILFPFLTFVMLYDKMAAIRAGNSMYLKRFGTLYRDFKRNKEWYWVQYYPIFLFRRMVFVIFLIVLLEYPEVQINAFIFFSWAVSVYIWIVGVCLPVVREAIHSRSCERPLQHKRNHAFCDSNHSGYIHNQHQRSQCDNLDWLGDGRSHGNNDFDKLHLCFQLHDLRKIQKEENRKYTSQFSKWSWTNIKE